MLKIRIKWPLCVVVLFGRRWSREERDHRRRWSIGHCFSAALHSERHRGLDGIVPCKLIVLVLACKKMKLWCLLVHEGASASARGRHFVIQQEAKWLALGTLSSYIQHIQFKCPMRFRFLKGRRGCCCECCGCCPGKEGGRG